MAPSFLLAFILLPVLPTPCHGCDCKILHPQTIYCMSDFVIIADILGPGENTTKKRGFKVNITKIFKIPKGITDIHEIYTPLSWHDCGYQLRTSQQSQLLIAGYLRKRSLQFTRCHLVYFWYKLTRQQRLGFELAYRRGCDCQIQPCLLCWHSCPQPDPMECIWKQRDCIYDTWEGELSTNFMCAPSETGHCEWVNVQLHHHASMISSKPLATIPLTDEPPMLP